MDAWKGLAERRSFDAKKRKFDSNIDSHVGGEER
jgi:hypothetical protein